MTKNFDGEFWINIERLYLHVHSPRKFTELLKKNKIDYPLESYSELFDLDTPTNRSFHIKENREFLQGKNYSFANFMENIPLENCLDLLAEIIFDDSIVETEKDLFNYYDENVSEWYSKIIDILERSNVIIDGDNNNLVFHEDIIEEESTAAPTCFISYSWDTKKHQDWVLSLANKLRENGVDVSLDKWLPNGGDLQHFMASKIKNSDYVILVLTPNYAKKADDGIGGVGSEYMIITGELNKHLKDIKYIPILKSGDFEDSAPAYITTKKGIDFKKSEEFDQKFDELLHELHGRLKYPRSPLGPSPFLSSEKITTGEQSPVGVSEDSFVDINAFLNEVNDKYILIRNTTQVPYFESKGEDIGECIVHAKLIENYEEAYCIQCIDQFMEFDDLNDIIQKYYSYFNKNTHYLSAFGINQETCNWFGYGPLNFITALKNQYIRYKQLRLEEEKTHHRELAYFIDEFDGGLFFIGCQPNRISKEKDSISLEHVNVGFLFSKQPFDNDIYKKFFNKIDKMPASIERIKSEIKSKKINVNLASDGFVINNPSKGYHKSVYGIFGNNSYEVDISESNYNDKIIVNFDSHHQIDDECEYIVTSAKSISFPTDGFTAKIVTYKGDWD
ncbi:toll/interleukin-1 receptor domain-containing protein [Methanococcoides sp. SA1]|nr:toll/interleukin-1 receptor domain-containing protein [Methanococcoides sp. SA1]